MAVFYHHLVPSPPLDAFVASIWLFRDEPRPHTAFNRVPLVTNMEAVTDAIGLSAKRFIERFKAQVGAHFIHEFRAFAGLTPTGYVASRTAFQNHVKFLQSDESVVLTG